MRGALIGCGFFAQNHLQSWAQIDGVDIVAVCDNNPVNLSNTAQAFDIPNSYDSAEKMFSVESIDFVDIVTSVPSHRELVILAAKYCLNVICQKPLAPSVEDATIMLKALGDVGRTLVVHENFRWQSPIRKAIDVIRSGMIGKPFFSRISFRSAFDVFSGQPYLATDEKFIIQDLGIHLLDLSRAISGNVLSVSAKTSRINPSIKGEDVATILLSHVGGATSIVDCSYATKRIPETFPETLLEVDGEEGSLRLASGYQMLIQKNGIEKINDVRPPMFSWAQRPWHNIQESVLLFQKNYVECCRQGLVPETVGFDNIQTLELVDAAYHSAKEDRVVKINER